jgi:hypothetical protein
MSDRPTRRELLRRVAASGAALTAAAVTGRLAHDASGATAGPEVGGGQVRDFGVRAEPGRPVLAIARTSRDPAVLTRLAIDALGGMTRFVCRGDVVAVKPNIGWDRLPIHAANTNPAVVAEVVQLALDEGRRRSW